MIKPTTFIVVRHEKVDNPSQIFYGVNRDLPISRQGMEDAEMLGSHLGVPVDAVVVSNLTRARMTAEKILEGLGLFTEERPRHSNLHQALEIQQDIRLTDVAYPEIEGGTIGEDRFITLASGVRIDLNDIELYANETLEHAAERFRAALGDIAERHPGQTVLIVSHGDPIAAGLAKLEEPTKDIPSSDELLEQGLYLEKGELAVFRLNQHGNLEGRIHRNPELSVIPQLLTEGNIRPPQEKK